MIVSVPFSAAAAPPEMPASSIATPRAASSAASSRVEPGLEVPRSTRIWPSRQAERTPPSPRTTASTTVLSGSDSSTTSTAATSAASEPAASIPRSAARAASES